MAEMMESIRNEERLMLINDSAVASGSVSRNYAQRHIASLQSGPKRAATRADLAAMGITCG